MALKTTKDSIDLGIIAVNGPAMCAFYRDVLGLTHQGDMPLPGIGTMHRFLCGTTVIKIVEPEKVPASRAAPGGLAGGTGYRYFTVSVSNLDDVVAAAQRAGRPIPIPRRKVRAGVEIAMIEDPDGNWVELLEQS